MNMLRRYAGAAGLCFAFLSVGATAAEPKSPTAAVVKVFVTANSMDYYRPWQSKGIAPGVGSGTVIEGKRILTNAHVVADHTFIQVKKEADPRKYTARVEAVGDDCDLALLTVDDPHFFDDIVPLEFGGLPKLQDNVIVIGYPQGGDKISITEGVVSRVEVTSYAQSGRKLLTIQIDAAINPGNSGGPVIQNGKLVGIAMQVFQSGQNIGYMIPVPIIEHFFNDLRDNAYDGFPMVGIEFDNTENPTLRRFYKIGDREGGVLVSKVMPFTAAFGKLKEGDILLKIDNVAIGEDGTFSFRGSERLSMSHLITSKQIGENIRLEILRDGVEQFQNIALEPFVPLVPPSDHFQKPAYLIFGGMVFTILSTDLLKSWGNPWWEKSPLNLVFYLIGAGRLNTEEKRDLVVLLNVLPDDINVGYHDIRDTIITKINGQDFKSFKEFVLLVDRIKKTEEYTIMETLNNSRIILTNKDVDEKDQQILERNNIPSRFSTEVAGWLGK